MEDGVVVVATCCKRREITACFGCVVVVELDGNGTLLDFSFLSPLGEGLVRTIVVSITTSVAIATNVVGRFDLLSQLYGLDNAEESNSMSFSQAALRFMQEPALSRIELSKFVAVRNHSQPLCACVTCSTIYFGHNEQKNSVFSDMGHTAVTRHLHFRPYRAFHIPVNKVSIH